MAWKVERNGDNKDIITDGNGRKITYTDLVESRVDRTFGKANCVAQFRPETGEAQNYCDALNRIDYYSRA